MDSNPRFITIEENTLTNAPPMQSSYKSINHELTIEVEDVIALNLLLIYMSGDVIKGLFVNVTAR